MLFFILYNELVTVIVADIHRTPTFRNKVSTKYKSELYSTKDQVPVPYIR